MSKVVREELVVGRIRLGLRSTSGRGKPLVMLHGLMDSAESWDPFARSLSRPTLAFDLPGFGESALAGDELEKWQKLFSRALEKLDVEGCFLLGHSLGGLLASSLAAARSEETRALLLIAPAGYGRIPLAQLLGRREMEFLLGRTAPGAMRFRPLVRLAYGNLFSHHHELSESLMERLTTSRRTMVPGIRKAMHILRSLSQEPFSESPYQGTVAALFGEHDRLIPPKRTIEGLRKVFPQARKSIFKGIGHHPQEESPAQTLRWIAKWSECRVREPLMLSEGEQLFD
ncbi:MAG: alpha/beta hydrolase [Thermoleophilia bacterium]|nr:alpha/beta hydrolase [Thermoleophilia bacterium]